jgi:hypothetical protein
LSLPFAEWGNGISKEKYLFCPLIFFNHKKERKIEIKGESIKLKPKIFESK